MSIEPYENRLGIVIRPLVLPIRNHEDPLYHLDGCDNYVERI